MKHPSRVRGPDQWTGPGNDPAARSGRDAARAEWFYGFRLAVRTDPGSRIVRARSIAPAAVSEREATPAVHSLLRHLAAVGFAGAPRLVGSGMEADGREVLTFIEGEFTQLGPWTLDGAAALSVGSWPRARAESSQAFCTRVRWNSSSRP